MPRTFTGHVDRHVLAAREQQRMLAPQGKRARDHPQLEPTVVWRSQPGVHARGQRLFGSRCHHVHLGEHRGTKRIVDSTSVVRVDQAQIGDFVPLIDIGHPRRREMKERHRDGVESPEPCERPNGHTQVGEK